MYVSGAVPWTHSELGLSTYTFHLLCGRTEVILIAAIDVIVDRIPVHGTRPLSHKL